MAVQIATSTQDFMLMQSNMKQGGQPASGGTENGFQGCFESMIKQSQQARPVSESQNGAINAGSKQIAGTTVFDLNTMNLENESINESFPADLLNTRFEEISEWLSPLEDELSDRMALIEKLAEMDDEVLADLFTPEELETLKRMQNTLQGLKNAASKMSRFDPDLILGSETKETPLHKALQELLGKLGKMPEGADSAVETMEDPEDTTNPVQTDAPSVELADAASDLAEELFDSEDEIAIGKDAVVRGEQEESELSAETGDIDAITRNDRFAELLGMMPANEASQNDKGTVDIAARDMDDLIRSAREAVAAMRRETGSDGQADDQGKSGFGASADSLTKKGALAVTRKAQTASPIAETTEKASDSSKANPFASHIASAMNTKNDGVPRANAAQQATLPGTTYTLQGQNHFGQGLNSVLEFMRHDGVDEARIIVEPPALGRIDVSLQASASGVEAVFKVDNEHLKQMLQQQLDVLKTSLQAQGIHVSGLAVDIKNRDEQKGRGDLYGTNKKSKRVGGVDAADEDLAEGTRLARLDLENGLLNWVA